MKSFIRFLLFLFLVLVVLAGFVFTLKNSSPVSLWLWAELAPRPLSLWIIGAFICGGVSGLLLGIGLWRKLRTGMQLRQLQSRLERSEAERSRLQQQLETAQATAKQREH